RRAGGAAERGRPRRGLVHLAARHDHDRGRRRLPRLDHRTSAQATGSVLMPPRNVPDRNLALELVRVSDAAALAAGRYVGRGDKEAADQAAVDGMHAVLHTIHMDGIVVIGEGEKDEAPMLANGEEVGDGSDPKVDIAVDPLEGTRLCALGMPNALAVIALAERGAMFDPGPVVYMEKMAGTDAVPALLAFD